MKSINEIKKDRNNKGIISLGILFLLLVSSLGYAFLTKEQGGVDDSVVNDGQIKLEEKKPVQIGGRWAFSYYGLPVYLTHSLEEVKEIEVDLDNLTINDFNSKNLYISSGSDSSLQEILINIGQFYPKVQEACYGKCDRNLPEKECNGDYNFIVIRESEIEKVYSEDNCIFIDGDIKSIDAFIYNIFEIVV